MRRGGEALLAKEQLSIYPHILGFLLQGERLRNVKCSDIVDYFIQCDLQFNLILVIHEQVGVRGHFVVRCLQVGCRKRGLNSAPI